MKMRIQIEIAPGELIDRITILEIKLARIDDTSKLDHVKNELATLSKSADRMRESILANSPEKAKLLDKYAVEVKEANEQVWDVLQKQRELEQAKDFGNEFVETSLAVYHVNDKRAIGKKKINELLDTDIAEVKSYPGTETPHA
jgi:hypothetical protein